MAPPAKEQEQREAIIIMPMPGTYVLLLHTHPRCISSIIPTIPIDTAKSNTIPLADLYCASTRPPRTHPNVTANRSQHRACEHTAA
jgi:hypothetical protein